MRRKKKRGISFSRFFSNPPKTSKKDFIKEKRGCRFPLRNWAAAAVCLVFFGFWFCFSLQSFKSSLESRWGGEGENFLFLFCSRVTPKASLTFTKTQHARLRTRWAALTYDPRRRGVRTRVFVAPVPRDCARFHSPVSFGTRERRFLPVFA